jgi:hypothetical protein
MSELVQVLRGARGLGRSVRTSETFPSTKLAPGYALHQWRNDPTTDQVEKLFFSTRVARAPHLDPVVASIAESASCSEVTFQGHRLHV